MSSVEDEVEEVAKEAAKDATKAYGSWFKSYMKIFSGRLLEWFIVYMFGYCNASFGWLMAPLFFLVLRNKRAKEKKVKFDLVRSLANSDEKEVLQEVMKFSDLPSWVTFPDMERVEWVNKMLRQLWPYAGHFTKDLCMNTIEPAIKDALKEYKISVFKFDKIILGDTPPRFSGLKVYDDTSRHEIIMDADFIYAGDCKFEVQLSKIKAGIKDLQISGRIRVVMKPLVRQMPLVGGLQVFFLNNPEVDFNLIGIADVFDMPGISDILRSIVIEQIANMMVLPNRYPIQLISDLNVADLKSPMPAGVIRLHVVEAQNLMKMDIGLLGMGKSDPYCILRLGAQKFQTRTINNTVNPTWDYCCEFLAEVTSGQEIDFDIYDSDDGIARDEFIGRANLDVQSIYNNGEVDMWVPLSDAKSGRLHVKATWLELSKTSDSLEKQLEEIRSLQNATKNPLHSACLMVWIDSAKKLNPTHKSIPDPFIRINVGNTKEETSVRLRTNDPVYEEGFTFLVRNPKTQEMDLEVWDQKSNTSQGKLELDLNTILQRKNLEIIGEEFSLSGGHGGMATVKLNLTLRILKNVEKKESAHPTPVHVSEKEVGKPVKPTRQLASQLVTQVAGDSSGATASQINVTPTRKATPEREEILQVRQKSSSPETEIIITDSPSSVPVLAIPKPESDGDSDVELRHREGAGVGAHGLGKMQLTVKYGARSNLVIVVHKVVNIPVEDDGEIPDPYVKMYLLPDKSKDSKRKTDVIKDSSNPVYDERFEYSVAPNDLTQRVLQVQVINKKGIFHMARSAILGQVHLDCGLLDPDNITQWYDLQPGVEEDDD